MPNCAMLQSGGLVASVFFDDGQVKLIHGHVIDGLKMIPDESISLVCTSPPYWALRAYGTEAQDWGDWRGELGHEPTPQMFVAHLVDVFREVRRVLKSDGCCFVNLGDRYAANGASGGGSPVDKRKPEYGRDGYESDAPRGRPNVAAVTKGRRVPDGIKPKDLVLIPERFALAMQEPYHVGPIKEPTDRAWLAGLIDADGSLGIRVSNKDSERGWNETYIPHLEVSQSDLPALERCVRITGLGRINVKARPDVDNRGIRSTRTFYTWRLDGQSASAVIRDIYPYLTIKQLQAQIVYTMNESLKWGRPTRNEKVPPAVMETRRALYAAIKALNQREDVTLPDLIAVPPADEPGWYVRSRIAWCKKAPMPESVKDRPTNAWEHIFLFSKNSRYFWDQEAVREQLAEGSAERYAHQFKDKRTGHTAGLRVSGEAQPRGDAVPLRTLEAPAGRNMWNYWVLGPDPSPEAHFATFPQEIPRRCIAAATSEKGECPQCGRSWVRVVERTPIDYGMGAADTLCHKAPTTNGDAKTMLRTPTGHTLSKTASTTTGWAPQCDHDLPPVPSTVLDIFVGSGTTTMVARSMLRRSIGIDLSETYLRDIALKKNNQMALMPTLELPA